MSVDYILALAAGIGCYGLFAFAWARRPDTEQPGPLDADQLARVQALKEARLVLQRRNIGDSVDPIDAINVARFILTGRDPFIEDAETFATDSDVVAAARALRSTITKPTLAAMTPAEVDALVALDKTLPTSTHKEGTT